MHLDSELRASRAAIEPLHAPIAPVREGEWLAEHVEPGQTFEEYLAADPNRPTPKRTTLYVQPLGNFDQPRSELLAATADLLGRFYGVPVRTLDRLDLAHVPDMARRLHPWSGDEQVLTTFVLEMLQRRRPADALAVLALTTADLWPGKDWNFVFGQASQPRRVGVWSLFRLGDPVSEAEICLRRTLKTAIHETGHMLGIKHCTRFECGINGANHLAEADEQPLWFCPEDEMKIWWACGIDPAARYHRLVEFAEMHGLRPEAELWRSSARAVEACNSERGFRVAGGEGPANA
jgi:archaemetzincin